MVGGEGPFGIILCPSRELARQTFDVVNYFCQHLKKGGFPELRTVLCIGEALEGIFVFAARPSFDKMVDSPY